MGWLYQMIKYEFRVLCYDDGNSYDFVKKAMNDFTIYEHLDIPGYDYAGVKHFSSDTAAQYRKKTLLQECGENVLKIDIYENRLSSSSDISKITLNQINSYQMIEPSSASQDPASLYHSSTSLLQKLHHYRIGL